MPVACFSLEQFAIRCEQTRLPHLCGEPVVLASAGATLQSVSEEAAACGIRAGQTVAGARSLCRDLIVLPYDRAAYEIAAHCIWDLFAVESSVVEPVSPEICFVEFEGRDIPERVRRLALYIATRARIPVRAGLAASKLVARQAAIQGREDQIVVTVTPGGEMGFLASLPLEALPRLDAGQRQRLQRLGVRTLGDVAALPPRELDRRFKQIGLLLHRLALGEDGDRVRPLWPPRRIERSLVFEEEVMDEPTLREALRLCALKVAGVLIRQREYCRALTLRVLLADGSSLEEMERPALPLQEAGALARAALRLLHRLSPEAPLLSVCLQASDLGAGSGVQLSLLAGDADGAGFPEERRRRLEATLATLRKRFGVGAVVTAGMLRQARRIGLWTYPLGHLLDEPVEVALTPQGAPARYWRRGRYHYEVKRVQNRWRETEWFWGSLSERTVYRVETEPDGFSELHQSGVRWRLRAVAD